ncbi:testis-expressed protein 50 [Peromyscus californicus insignis]|uniref:testis-expressed protein 50 n=1 Tax=Peromyscus californicus insignis TaxID=564181 RepID=UPI0022A6ED9A|nr:testis-expressed protein 50 [Peromyscus californicus insignis]
MKMSNWRLSVLSPLLFLCFFREGVCICDGTTWTKVGWEIFPDEVLYLKVKASSSHCLPYPLDKLCCNFANLDLVQSSLRLLYILVEALFLILFVLSVHYLWMKWMKHQRKLKKQASLEKHGDDLESASIYDIEQILCRLLATTSMMTKFLKQVSQHSSFKKVKQHHRVKRKKSEGGEESKNTKPMPMQCSSVKFRRVQKKSISRTI